MERILRVASLGVGAAVALLSAAALALAAPMAVYTAQGETFSVTSRTVSNSAVCVFAPPGVTCTGGVTTSGNVRAVTVQNLHATDALYCDETSGSVAANTGLRIGAGGSITFEKAAWGARLFCVRGSGSDITATVIIEAK